MASPAFLVFQKFSGEDPEHPFQSNVFIFQTNIAQSTQQLVRSKVFKWGMKLCWEKKRGSTTIICDLVGYEFVGQGFAVPLPYHHLSVIVGFLRPGSSKNARKFNANLLFIFETTFLCLV